MAAGAGYSTFNGDNGVGFSSSWISCDAAIADSSNEEVLGMSKW